jgi:hypothetical protein
MKSFTFDHSSSFRHLYAFPLRADTKTEHRTLGTLAFEGISKYVIRIEPNASLRRQQPNCWLEGTHFSRTYFERRTGQRETY